jgi:hypothetical protein
MRKSRNLTEFVKNDQFELHTYLTYLFQHQETTKTVILKKQAVV